MATMDIFTSDAFRTVELTGAVERLPFVPEFLDSLGIFTPTPSRTRHVAIERRNGVLSLVKTSPVGAPLVNLVDDKRDIRDVRTVRIAKDTTIYAEELNGIRAFGTETELMQVQAEGMRRLGRVKNDISLTLENMRLGAIQGVLADSDGSVIQNWYTFWGITAPALIDFNMDSLTIDVTQQCKNVVRTMMRAGQGAFRLTTRVHALAGDNFYDALIQHPSVKQFYLNWQAASAAREQSADVFGSFEFGGIVWHNYRGTDDNTTVAVPTNRAAFFPVGAPDVFQVAYGPAEFEPWINTPGNELYALTIPDLERRAFTKFELYSYPLHICTRPEMLLAAKRFSTDS